MTESLTTLLSSPHAPPFFYLHHPHHPSTSAVPRLPTRCIVAHLDAIEHSSPRLFYSGALSKYGRDEEGEVSNWDGFSRGLKEIWAKAKGKRKSDIMEDGGMNQMVLIITKAERLRTVLGAGWAVITRLAEMVSVQSEGERCELTGYRRVSL